MVQAGLIRAAYTSPYKREAGGQGQKGEAIMGAEAGGIHFKNGRRGHKPRNMGDLQKLEN